MRKVIFEKKGNTTLIKTFYANQPEKIFLYGSVVSKDVRFNNSLGNATILLEDGPFTFHYSELSEMDNPPTSIDQLPDFLNENGFFFEELNGLVFWQQSQTNPNEIEPIEDKLVNFKHITDETVIDNTSTVKFDKHYSKGTPIAPITNALTFDFTDARHGVVITIVYQGTALPTHANLYYEDPSSETFDEAQSDNKPVVLRIEYLTTHLFASVTKIEI